MWVGCHKWKLQDINFMILTGSKRLFTALKDRGMNTIRLVWVNPNDDKASGHCSKEETVVMALCSKNANHD
jgi:arabinogalactan endo-1,4-beta-galactosidase